MTGDTEAIDTLQELFPQRRRTDLERYLAASQQNLERAFQAIDRGLLDDARPKKRARTRGGSNGLAAWIGKRDGVTTDAGVLVLDDSDDEVQLSGPAAVFPGELDRTRSAPAKPVRSAYELLKPAERPTQPEPPVATHVNLPPLTLRTSDMVAKHTKGLVTLVENALPQELASRLYVKMVKESLGEGEGDKPCACNLPVQFSVDRPHTHIDGISAGQPNKWYLVDREVTSPHTSCFYRSLPEQITAQSGYDAAGFDESATYWYNGAKRTARPFTSDQEEARLLVREFVRVLLEGRERHPLEYEGEWDPNVAVANCYRGSKEVSRARASGISRILTPAMAFQSVGFHSDVLQYLGPFPTIASLTLGCTRPFRLRPFIPSGSAATEAVPPPEIRTLDIVLPHNSLLIMHAGCQERYKHAVPPVNGMDVFRLPRTSLEVSDCFSEEEKEVLLARKWNERINVSRARVDRVRRASR